MSRGVTAAVVAVVGAVGMIWVAEGNRVPPAVKAVTQGGVLQDPQHVLTLTAPLTVDKFYTVSGWMGDGERGRRYVAVVPTTGKHARPDDTDSFYTKVSYQAGSTGWAGVYWQAPPDNWGDVPGNRITGASRITFWAAGEMGGEIVEFKAGGIDAGKRHMDSFQVGLGNVVLTGDWKKYEISLLGQDLSSVIGAFAWVATRDANPNGLTFYLDAIRYE